MKQESENPFVCDLPNIGKKMARWLLEAGISSQDELMRIGSIEAAIRIAPYRPSGSTCRSALNALEGAIRGIRWHAIPKIERDRLWKDYQDRISR